MNKPAAYLYLFLTLITLFIAVRVYNSATDAQNKNSLKYNINQFNDVLDENSEISR